jgi:hypothetical protein
MVDKALSPRFWKPLCAERRRVERLRKVGYIYHFMKRLRGNRDVFKKKLSPAEQAEEDRKAKVSSGVRSCRVMSRYVV